MKDFDLKKYLAEGKLLKEEKRSVVDYDNRDDRTTELFLDNGDSVEVDVIELYDNLKENNPEDLDENNLLKEEEFKLYTTNVEYDNGEDGYMYQLVDAETGEENEIGFDQLYFDRDGNLLQLGIDFNDFEQTSYQDEEVSAEEAMKIYNELK